MQAQSVRPLILVGAVSPLVKAVGVLVSTGLYPGYSHVSQALSELGTPDSPASNVHRSTTTSFGLMQLVFAAGLWRMGKRPLAAIVGLNAVGAFGGAAFTGSPGLPLPGQPGFGPTDVLHNAFGLAGGLALIAEPIVGA